MPIPQTRLEAEEMYKPYLDSWPFQPMEVEPGILLRKTSDLYYVYSSEPKYPVRFIKALYSDGTIVEWLDSDTTRETKPDGEVVITNLNELEEFPNVSFKMRKRDFNAGAKSCREYVNQVGSVRVIRFLNTKIHGINKYDDGRVISYWYGYYSVIKEIENAD